MSERRMLRSWVNGLLDEAEQSFARMGLHLPPFARWTPQEFVERQTAAQAIIDARLGWDVTDFGQGDFARCGAVTFVLRNGQLAQLAEGGGRVYAERAILLRDGQGMPLQTHLLKTKDLVNRGGATLVVGLCGSDESNRPDTRRGVAIEMDGVPQWVEAGRALRLEPGESLTLRPGDWHRFRAEGGTCLIAEISSVNDDVNDNLFAESIERFPLLDEDCEPDRLLIDDYEVWLDRDWK